LHIPFANQQAVVYNKPPQKTTAFRASDVVPVDKNEPLARPCQKDQKNGAPQKNRTSHNTFDDGDGGTNRLDLAKKKEKRKIYAFYFFQKRKPGRFTALRSLGLVKTLTKRPLFETVNDDLFPPFRSLNAAAASKKKRSKEPSLPRRKLIRRKRIRPPGLRSLANLRGTTPNPNTPRIYFALPHNPLMLLRKHAA
jgi:hypothetical protein